MEFQVTVLLVRMPAAWLLFLTVTRKSLALVLLRTELSVMKTSLQLGSGVGVGVSVLVGVAVGGNCRIKVLETISE